MMIINRTKSVTWHIVADHLDVTLIIYRLWSTVNFIQFMHRQNSNKHTSAILFKQWQYFHTSRKCLSTVEEVPDPTPHFRIGISWLIKDWIHIWWKWLENFFDPLLNNLHACIFNFNISYRRLSLFGHTNQLTETRHVFSFFWNLLMYKEIHTRIFYAEM